VVCLDAFESFSRVVTTLEKRFADDVSDNCRANWSEMDIIVKAGRRWREGILDMNNLCAILFRNATRHFAHLGY
jgi:hypothetical protein